MARHVAGAETVTLRGHPVRRAARPVFVVPAVLLGGCSKGVLDPQGPIALASETILFNSLGIMLAIVIPTIVATLAVAWWFRASNSRARHLPDWQYSGQIEMVVWAIPAMTVLLLGGIGWIGSHDLDPSRPIASQTKAVTVEVVSLDWKWLFIYPEQGIASVNELTVPAMTPISFRLTSSGVMNSFFVPQLGSQIYTMANMVTRLNLQADRPGRYFGLSAQFSGDGFSDMHFDVDAVPQDRFEEWVADVRGKGPTLDAEAYAGLAKPSGAVAPTTYGGVAPDLFQRIVSAGAAPLDAGDAARAGPARGDLDHTGSRQAASGSSRLCRAPARQARLQVED
ncbi:ubiquinol oxidase subunit II [Labrys monachus]|uniref:Ubiquinol oxidase polypeptide II n=1 Tax=Labrys monachus TaxID=217067 RepID=A0ABU0FD04_9HYPH|nr:ubiquinol oxidase subunit II [Labrys monachus]MDQ0391950.1 cytochrome o ubiquinol oxidase subunit 2 [Labrys monachus]